MTGLRPTTRPRASLKEIVGEGSPWAGWEGESALALASADAATLPSIIFSLTSFTSNSRGELKELANTGFIGEVERKMR
jgi:hypothetical protein